MWCIATSPRGSTGCRGRAGTGASCIALGVAWVLDGLEVTLVGSVGSVLERPDTLGLSAAEIGWAGSLYVAGAVIGALCFGRLADRLGRKRLFFMTLAVYMAATVATAFTTGFAGLRAVPLRHRLRHRRRVRGDQLGDRRAHPRPRARPRGPRHQRQLLARRGARRGARAWCCSTRACSAPCSAGASASCSARVLARGHPARAPLRSRKPALAARARPRRRGRAHRRARSRQAVREHRPPLDAASAHAWPVARRPCRRSREVAHVLLRRYPQRSAVVLALMMSQAFFYNAIFFTYALVLTRFYGVDAERRRPLHLALRGRQRARAAAARASLRPRRPARDDRGDLRAVGRRRSR